MAKLRTRNHKVVLARSRGGDAGITFVLVLLGIFMFIPMYYTVIQSLKPLDELWMFPPRFYVSNPTAKNFRDLFTLMSGNLVPFSRYIFNTIFTSVSATLNNVGPGLSLVGPTGNFAFFSVGSKLVFIFTMLAGRLEVFPMLLLFAPSTWRK